MTKMKSKKMTKSTFAIIIMAIVMVAMLAFGGTYAYFTAKAAKATGTVTTAVVSLATKKSQEKTMTMSAGADNLLPGQTVTATVTLDNSLTTVDTWVFVDLTYAIKSYTTEGTLQTSTKFELASVTSTSGVVFEKLTGETGNIYASTAVVSDDIDEIDVVLTFTYVADVVNNDGAGVPEMGATYEISVNAGSIQTVSEEDGTTALSNSDAYAIYKTK